MWSGLGECSERERYIFRRPIATVILPPSADSCLRMGSGWSFLLVVCGWQGHGLW